MEIKEFTPNDEDNAFAATLEKEGKASVDNRSIGRRVRKAIIDSAPQLRRYQDTPLPEILLLHDNLASGSYGGIIDYLDPMNVGAGMFGEPVIRFWRDPSLKPAEAPDATHGGGRQLTETTRLYIGALGVMKVDSADEIRIDFFHNPSQLSPSALVTFCIKVIVITSNLIIPTTRHGRGTNLLAIAKAPDQAMQRTASQTAFLFLSVPLPPSRYEARFSGLAVADLVSR